MYIGAEKTGGLGGGETHEMGFLGQYFYKFLSAAITEDPSVRRYAINFDFLFSAAADELATYIEVNRPSTGIVQQRPEFTNIDGGYGVFSSRFNKNILGLAFSNHDSFDSLRVGTYTSKLGFQ